MEMMMSICLIGFLIGWFRRTQHYHHLVDFKRIRDFTWRVSDCEELVGHLRVHLGRNETNYFMY